MMKRRSTAGLVAVAVAMALGCGGQTRTTTGSESHFLDTCLETGCGPGLSCICGTCTQTCAAASDCAALAEGSTCVEVADLPNTSSCSTSRATSVCDVACSIDADCSSAGGDLRCVDGVCRRIEPDVCRLPQDVGQCSAPVTQYWHDPATHQCEPFTYRGCGGNGNRFDSLEACQRSCNVLSGLTCNDVQTSIKASIERAEYGNNVCLHDSDCSVIPLDNACYHGCSSPALSSDQVAPVRAALQDTEATWCAASAELGCVTTAPPCPLPPDTVACVHGTCALTRDACPSNCQCSVWDTTLLGDRSGCAGVDLYVPDVTACSGCQVDDLYLLVANRGQQDFNGVLDIVPVDADAGPVLFAPFSKTLAIPSGGFVGVTVGMAGSGEVRLKLSAPGDCNPANDEFSGAPTGALGCH